MQVFIGKSNERILCKPSKSEILRLYSIVKVAMETTKTSHFTCQQNFSSVYFSLAKFQLVSCNFSLAMIWQIKYTHKLPKPCSATLSHVEFSCMVEGPFSRLIFTHLAPLMKQLSYVDLLTFKRSRISGLSSMICRAAWHLGKICALIYGGYENSDLENTDLRPPKNSHPWVSRKLRPSIFFKYYN